MYKTFMTISIAISAIFLHPAVLWAKTNVELIEPTSQSIQFFKKQVESSSSVSSALKAVIERYPHKTTDFVSIAFKTFPDNYKEIISVSVSEQPMFVDEIIMVANEYNVANVTDIIEIAVNAEPSYAGLATKAACKYKPNEFNNIIKSAVNAEPDSADQIAQKLVSAYPSKTIEILVTTIKEVPYVGKYVLEAMLATVNDDKLSEDMIIASVEQLAQYPDAIERVIELAKQNDIEASKIKESALRSGLDTESVNALLLDY